MKLYLLTQSVNNGYDSCIVCAKNEADAKTITPDGKELTSMFSDWAKPEDVTCEEIGTANKAQVRGVILASFNAG